VPAELANKEYVAALGRIVYYWRYPASRCLHERLGAGGKYLLVGPDWQGEKPTELLGVLRMPTNVSWVAGRSFAAHTPESKSQSLGGRHERRVRRGTRTPHGPGDRRV